MPIPSGVELLRIGPLLVLTVGMTVLFGLGAVRASREKASLWASVFLVVAMVALFASVDRPGGAFGLVAEGRPMLALDGFSLFFGALFLVAGILGVVALHCDARVEDEGYPEALGLLMSVLVGMFLVAEARHLLPAYIGFELLSVPAFAMTAFRKGTKRGTEAGLKYVVYGGVSSGALLYGFSILYGLTGSLYYEDLRAVAMNGGFRNAAALVAGLLAISGFYYKIAAAPFHWWCPDAYEGAAPSVAGFLSVGPKAAGFAFLTVFSSQALGLYTPFAEEAIARGGAVRYWLDFLLVGAFVSMTYGNLAAIAQENTQRLLAYSSIAHSGYILLGLAVGTFEGLVAAVFYLAVYLLMNLGAFLFVAVSPEGEWMRSLSGLGRTRPWASAAMAAFLFSLTGLPPFGGFVGKLLLFWAAVGAGAWAGVFLLAANSVVALYYYARVLKQMYIVPPVPTAPAPLAPGAAVTFAFLVLGLVVLGLGFAPVLAASGNAAGYLETAVSPISPGL